MRHAVDRCRRWCLAVPALLLCCLFLLNGCAALPLPAPEPTAERSPSDPLKDPQPRMLKGLVNYTNDILVSYATRHAVALVDLQGFVRRDADWKIPAQSLVFGSLQLNKRDYSGQYRLYLPIQPPGGFIDIDHNGKLDGRVQVFSVAVWDDPLTDRDQYHHGWPSNLASTILDPDNHDEITGGKLVIWAADDQQQFSSDFGADRRLFTDDDPVAAIPAGYSIVDLDTHPFHFTREENPEIPLFENVDLAVKDFSNETYTEAFHKLFEQVRRDYAFNGVEGKAPSWDALYDQLAPRVAEAEQRRDPQALFLALHDFTLAFHDGHVSLDGGDLEDTPFDEQFGGGYGFALRELDDKRYLVTFVQEDGPAAEAGIRVGDELTTFNGQPVLASLVKVNPWNGPFSTIQAQRSAQLRYLVRAPIGTQAELTIKAASGAPKTVTLKAVDEVESLHASSPYRGTDPAALPVEYQILDSGLGYVRINSNEDDLDLIYELFERALSSFEYHEVPGVIVDLRHNDGGAPLYLADYLSKKTVDLGTWQYYNAATQRFEAEDTPDQIIPVDNPYTYDKLAVLVDQSCFSACEIEAYAFSKLPDAVVVGANPSAGVVADVARGQYWLPEGITLQVSVGRYVGPDGALLLEGYGVAPTLRVPLDAQSALSDDDDAVLHAAEQALLK